MFKLFFKGIRHIFFHDESMIPKEKLMSNKEKNNKICDYIVKICDRYGGNPAGECDYHQEYVNIDMFHIGMNGYSYDGDNDYYVYLLIDGEYFPIFINNFIVTGWWQDDLLPSLEEYWLGIENDPTSYEKHQATMLEKALKMKEA